MSANRETDTGNQVTTCQVTREVNSPVLAGTGLTGEQRANDINSAIVLNLFSME